MPAAVLFRIATSTLLFVVTDRLPPYFSDNFMKNHENMHGYMVSDECIFIGFIKKY
ncbi:MAG: hypothetical protein K6C94_03890 [Candidatus Gastranaerophilales bacterium]|nr:hypothetical protein [Candidatus Gastranaerophilales bacterium]